nr:hypothetical protein [Parachlamydiaceae bacterium]
SYGSGINTLKNIKAQLVFQLIAYEQKTYELENINFEIDTLKRNNKGVNDKKSEAEFKLNLKKLENAQMIKKEELKKIKPTGESKPLFSSISDEFSSFNLTSATKSAIYLPLNIGRTVVNYGRLAVNYGRDVVNNASILMPKTNSGQPNVIVQPPIQQQQGGRPRAQQPALVNKSILAGVGTTITNNKKTALGTAATIATIAGATYLYGPSAVINAASTVIGAGIAGASTAVSAFIYAPLMTTGIVATLGVSSLTQTGRNVASTVANGAYNSVLGGFNSLWGSPKVVIDQEEDEEPQVVELSDSSDDDSSDSESDQIINLGNGKPFPKNQGEVI